MPRKEELIMKQHSLMTNGIMLDNGLIMESGNIVNHARKIQEFSVNGDHTGLMKYYYESRVLTDEEYEMLDDVMIDSCIGRVPVTHAYAHSLEQYETTHEMIPKQIQQLIQEDAAARGINFTPTKYEEIIMEYLNQYDMSNEVYDKVHSLAKQHADYLSERKALGLEE